MPAVLVALFAATAAHAQQPAVEFSAETYQTTPQAQPQTSRMFVGKGRVRTERDVNGQQMIEIVDMDNRKAILILPQQGTYMERSAAAPAPARAADQDPTPCAGVPGSTCKLFGDESVNGRDAQKWEMVVNQDGRPVTMLIWIDKERHLPLKQFWPDGTVTELRMLGREQLGGRETEKWETKTARPDGQSTVSYQWFDPELQIAIREEMPGGYLRELRDIQVGAQPQHLFEVPGGLKKVEPPPAPTGPVAQ
jgi:hypothetical protein